MTHTFYIDVTGVNDRQLAKLFSAFYGIHPEIHIVDQTNQCDSKSNKYRFTHLEWLGLLVSIAGCAFSGRPLARGDWKCWWAIGKPLNGRPPGEWK